MYLIAESVWNHWPMPYGIEFCIGTSIYDVWRFTHSDMDI